jgi:hypothetical protein
MGELRIPVSSPHRSCFDERLAGLDEFQVCKRQRNILQPQPHQVPMRACVAWLFGVIIPERYCWLWIIKEAIQNDCGTWSKPNLKLLEALRWAPTNISWSEVACLTRVARWEWRIAATHGLVGISRKLPVILSILCMYK